MDDLMLKYAIYIFEDDRFYNLLYSNFGIKIIMHTKENGHNLPHIHIKYKDKEAVVSLVDGSFIKGNIRKSKYKYAEQFIRENIDDLRKRYSEVIIV